MLRARSIDTAGAGWIDARPLVDVTRRGRDFGRLRREAGARDAMGLGCDDAGDFLDFLGNAAAAVGTGGVSLALQAGGVLPLLTVPKAVRDVFDFLYKASGIDKQLAFWKGMFAMAEGAPFPTDQMVDALKGGLHMAAQAAAFVPGIGQIAGPVLAFADALVEGEDVSEALLNAAAGAVPGGVIAKEAWIAGRSLAESVIAGKSLEEAGVKLMRDEAIGNAGGGDNAKYAAIAFDTALALARGKKVQDALQDVALQAATALAGSAVDALAKEGEKLGEGALKEIASRLPEDTIKKAIATGTAVKDSKMGQELGAIAERMATDPTIKNLTSTQAIASKLGVEVTDVQSALAALDRLTSVKGVGEMRETVDRINASKAVAAQRALFRSRVTMVHIVYSRDIGRSRLTTAVKGFNASVQTIQNAVYRGGAPAPVQGPIIAPTAGTNLNAPIPATFVPVAALPPPDRLIPSDLERRRVTTAASSPSSGAAAIAGAGVLAALLFFL